MCFAQPLSLIFCIAVVSLSAQIDRIQIPQPVVITGKVLDHKRFPDRSTLSFIVDDLGTMEKLEYTTGIEEDGSFAVRFDRYHPQDIYLSYGRGFWLLVQPGDSIHLEFEAKRLRMKRLRSARIAGDQAAVNTLFLKYQQKYSRLLSNWKNTKWTRRYDAENYRAKWEQRIRLRRKKDENFIRKFQPPAMLQDWIRNNTQADYYRLLLFYPGLRKTLRDLPVDTNLVGDDYYDFLSSFPVYNWSSLENIPTSRHLTIGYVWRYFGLQAQQEAAANPRLDRDSILLEKISVQLGSDTILHQLALTSFLNYCLSNYDLSKYHRYARQWIGEELTFSFLVDPLQARARALEKQIDHPQLTTNTILEKFAEGRDDQLLAQILERNRGKTVYIDVWATWCGPCLVEMPQSKALHTELAEEDIAFVFLCIESPEQAWQPTLARLQLPGQHYLLTKEQSNSLRHAFGIVGIPFYILVDRDGNILEQGSHLRPGRKETREKLIRATSGK